jgi:hypothetical protein
MHISKPNSYSWPKLLLHWYLQIGADPDSDRRTARSQRFQKLNEPFDKAMWLPADPDVRQVFQAQGDEQEAQVHFP